MPTFDFEKKCQWTGHRFSQGDIAMLCLNCERVTKISSYEKRTRPGEQLCNCNNPNFVRAVASVSTEIIPIEPNQSSSSVRTSTAGREQLNFRNTSSNTPPRNPPNPTVNLLFTNSNISSNSRNTTSSSSSSTTPSNSSRTQGSSLSGWIYGVAIVATVAITAALSPGMSAWFTAQFSQFTNNYTTHKNHQPQLSPEQVVTTYYQLATSNPEADLPYRTDALKNYWKQKAQGNKTKYFFNDFQKVDVYLFKTLTQSPTKAKVKVWLKYVPKDRNKKTTCESRSMELIFDQSKGQWLINKVFNDGEYNLDCGK